MNDLKRPQRAFEITIRVSGDTWDDVLRELESLWYHVSEHGTDCRSVGGGVNVGHSVSIVHNPDMTNERYFAELTDYLDHQRYAEKQSPPSLEMGTQLV